MPPVHSGKIVDKAQNIIVLHPALNADENRARARLNEAIGLAKAIDLNVVHSEYFYIRSPKAKTLLGQGIVDLVKAYIQSLDVQLVLVDGTLSPVQQRNLEKTWQCKVIDRTGIILEIFGERARTSEGYLQVELAALSYQRSRLVRSWTHLERQRGGLGFIGGPGETQLEADKRIISKRINKIKVELETVKRTRHLHRSARKKVPYPVVALVGYTNAGKSTLFNTLTAAKVMAEDMLFATLDPTMRSLRLPSHQTIILSDTVGFISDLPTQLIAAFQATLEEVMSADLIVHVRDMSHPDSDVQKYHVLKILTELGLEQTVQTNFIEVLNKVDLIPAQDLNSGIEIVDTDQINQPNTIQISALTGQGLDKLLQAISQFLSAEHKTVHYVISVESGEILAWLHAHSDVINQSLHADDQTQLNVTVRISQLALQKFERYYGIKPILI